MKKVLLLYILLSLVGADDSNQPLDREKLKTIAGTLGVFAVDQAIENRWEIYSALTGKENFMQKKEENVAAFKQAAVDLGVGYSIRTGLDSAYTAFMDKGLWVIAAMVVGAAVGTECFGYRRRKH